MANIFLSHSEQDRDAAQQLAAFLEGQGRTVWCGEARDASVAEHASARVVIAIWSKASLASPFVLQQAIAARDARKLLQVTREVQPKEIPLRQDGPLLDVSDFLQISLAVMPYCASRSHGLTG